MTDLRHFLDIDRLDTPTLRGVLDDAAAMKRAGRRDPVLAGRTLACVFEKPSMRTRVSFEVAMLHLGGHAVMVEQAAAQLGQRETIADATRVLTEYVDAIMLRTSTPDNLLEMAEVSGVPVINGLTDTSHPCQIMADVMTYEELKGPIEGRKIAWSGDGNNVACSWIHAAVRFGFELHIASPQRLQPPAGVLDWARENGGTVNVGEDPQAAVSGADCVVTDTWVSMGDGQAEVRHKLLEPFRVDGALMAQAKDDAIFMHCLPAHRGDEVTGEVIDGPRSAVWTEAGNRLHAQKAILKWCLRCGDGDA